MNPKTVTDSHTIADIWNEPYETWTRTLVSAWSLTGGSDRRRLSRQPWLRAPPGSPRGSRPAIRVYSTRPDTLFGATYMVLAPEHPLVDVSSSDSFVAEQWPDGTPTAWRGSPPAATPAAAVRAYQERVAAMSGEDRIAVREKIGVFAGAYALNPVNGERIPIWIADCVLSGYGTGAIMAVPAHDHVPGVSSSTRNAETMRLHSAVSDAAPTDEQARVLHRTIKTVSGDMKALRFNPAIARLIEFVNVFTSRPRRARSSMEAFRLMLALAPHIAEERWQALGHATTLAYERWPTPDPALTKDDAIDVVVQLNGKTRSRITLSADAETAAIETAALADTRVQRLLAGRRVRKVIVVPGKLVNLVV